MACRDTVLKPSPLAVLAALTALGACLDQRAVVGPPVTLSGSAVIVSNAVAVATLPTTSAEATTGGVDSIVYVSLPPGTVDLGTSITIRNSANGFSRTDPLVAGGLDPVPVPATAGDSLLLSVTNSSGASGKVAVVVTAARPPVIVRTVPPPRKRDVPLNAQIQVVFSEPMDPHTITPANVQLLRNGAAVSGTVQIAGDGLRADFVPESLLIRTTEYQLMVAAAVSDLSGATLGDPVVVDFVTGDQATASPVVSITVTPGNAALVAFAGDTQPAFPGMVFAPPGAVLLTATPRDANGTPLTSRTIGWTSSDTSVAAFRVWGSNGNTNVYVAPAAPGIATITATVDGVRGVALITVLRATLTPAAAALRVGDTVRVRATVSNLAGALQAGWSVGWGTSGGAVEVDWNTGLVTARAPGLQLVYVSFDQGGTILSGGFPAGSAFLRITVGTAKAVTSLDLAPDTVRTVPNASLFVRAVLRDGTGDTTAAPLSWSSSSPGDVDVTNQFWGLAWNEAEVDVSAGARGVFSVTATAGSPSARATVVSDYIAITAASLTTQRLCVLASSGLVYCKGTNAMGQSGFGITGSPFDVGPVAVSGGLTFTAISSSVTHSCAIATTGDAYCWGSNVTGQLGTAALTEDCSAGPCSPSPVPVAGGQTFVQVATASGLPSASGHTCGRTGTGAAYCWGSNDMGQLGDGTTIGRATPVPVAGGLSFTTIDAGYSSCGLTAQGLAYCWGPSGAGWFSSTPRPVAGGLAYTRLSLGCALGVDGTAYCFTAGADSLTPVAVAPGLTFTDLSNAGSHQCGLAAGGVVSCWGYYDPNPNDENDEWVFLAPTVLGGGLTFASLSAGASELSCGISAGGVAYCWQFPGLTPFKLWGQR